METPTLIEINQITTNFLSSKTPEVLAIRGKWGVGKTYAWKLILKEARFNSKIDWEKTCGLKNYSYISLFGVNDLNQLKRTIFENTIPSISIGEEYGEPNLETFGELTGKLIKRYRKHVKEPGILSYFSPVDIRSINDSLPNLAIKNQLICLDDLEHKGKDLDIKDILGLVNHLKEDRQCKIVLLFNEDENGIENIDKYREKVFDLEVEFNPTVSEVSDIVLTRDNKFKNLKSEFIAKFELSNIRLASKVNFRFKEIEKLLNDEENELAEEILFSYFFFSLCKFKYDESIYPPISYVKKGLNFFNREFDIDFNAKQTSKKEEDLWNETIKKNGKQVLSTLDELLIQQIETGLLDTQRFIEELDKKRKTVEHFRLKKNWLEQVELFRYTLKGDYKDTLSELNERFQKGMKALGIDHLNVIVDILDYLGETDLLNKNIEQYFSQKESDFLHREIVRRTMSSLGDQLHPSIKQKCIHLLNNSSTTVSLTDAIQRLYQTTSPNDEYLLEKIESSKESEIKDVIKNLDNEILFPVINDFFDLNDNRGKSGKKIVVKKKVQEIVKQISKENKRNELVLKPFINKGDDTNE